MHTDGRHFRACRSLFGCALAFACGVLLQSLAATRAAEPAGRDEAATCTGLAPGPAFTVTRIVDAETIALDDGSELRLIGALAPRAIDVGAEPGTWPLEIAAIEELRALVLARSIELGYGGERSDRYGRQQAQAFVRDGGERRWVQGHLLAQGLARAYTQAGNRACAEALLAAERSARKARRGLWAEAAYAVRSAERATELPRYRSTFQVLEGRPEKVSQGRSFIYLNFAGSRPRAFSVSLRRDERGLLGPYAADPKALEGRQVRVRGWIEQRRGPVIELSRAGLIEVLEAEGLDSSLPMRPGPATRLPRTVPPEQLSTPETKPPGLVETGR